MSDRETLQVTLGFLQVGQTDYVLQLLCILVQHIRLTCCAASVQVFQLLFINLATVSHGRRMDFAHLHKALAVVGNADRPLNINTNFCDKST